MLVATTIASSEVTTTYEAYSVVYSGFWIMEADFQTGADKESVYHHTMFAFLILVLVGNPTYRNHLTPDHVAKGSE